LTAVEIWLVQISSVVLHPAGVREDLAELALGRVQRPAFAVEDDGARAGGSLVEREDVFHGALE
jgi:hypothetical protein